MSASAPLKQEVTEQLPWLFQELGFRVVQDSFEPKSFGNSFVTLESPRLRVRFVRDRGQVSVEVAALSEPTTWWNLEHVCEIISGRSVELGFELSTVSTCLRNIFSALIDCFGPKFPEMKDELQRRAEERKQALLRRLSS